MRVAQKIVQRAVLAAVFLFVSVFCYSQSSPKPNTDTAQASSGAGQGQQGTAAKPGAELAATPTVEDLDEDSADNPPIAKGKIDCGTYIRRRCEHERRLR